MAKPQAQKKSHPKTLNQRKLLLEAAITGLKNSYSPYSRFPVGAAVATDKGIFYGCNIENASFGGTVCAERVAMLKAKSEGAKKFLSILVVTPQEALIPPCGLCLQTMAEFLTPDGIIYLASTKNEKTKEFCLKDLLPESFSREDLLAR